MDLRQIEEPADRPETVVRQSPQDPGQRVAEAAPECVAGDRGEVSLPIWAGELEATLEQARRKLSPVRDLRPDLYATPAPIPFEAEVGA